MTRSGFTSPSHWTEAELQVDINSSAVSSPSPSPPLHTAASLMSWTRFMEHTSLLRVGFSLNTPVGNWGALWGT